MGHVKNPNLVTNLAVDNAVGITVQPAEAMPIIAEGMEFGVGSDRL
jgi:hypothetical protein